MRNIIALDCTLRDGGYCNKWRFRNKNIIKIVSGLVESGIEIIECGFLTERVEYDCDITKYTNVQQLEGIIPEDYGNSRFVVMSNYGEYNFENLPPKSKTPLDGIRVAFHKKNRYEALETCKQIKAKGYEVFIQPMVSMLYSDSEFIELIKLANEIKPSAFYVVDSFGMMDKTEVLRYFQLAKENLNEDILIGFHAHNNLQLAYSNALALMEAESKHSLIIDCSIYGMGRGAGNLNSELFLNELNKNHSKEYKIKPLLMVMDEVINRFYEENPWGYSLPNYLSAVHMLHPNYASYLNSKKTLTVEEIDDIFFTMPTEKKNEYDEKLIEELYINYMSRGITRIERMEEIRKATENREVLLIAPGRSAVIQSDKVLKFVKENTPVVISINHEYSLWASDYIFVSNIRRFKDLPQESFGKVISTSNIKTDKTYISTDYFKLTNRFEYVRDNATLMALKFVKNELGMSKVYVAGFDGYSHDAYANFETRDMALLMPEERFDEMNRGMMMALKELSRDIVIDFITDSLLKR